MDKDNNAADTFVSVAHVASELFKAQSVAEELSITSKNARALAVRAGSTAAGFNEITRFIEDLSKITIEAARSINLLAISQTKITDELFRTGLFISSLKKVDYSPKDGKVNDIENIFNRVEVERKDLESKISSSFRKLAQRLDETKMRLRATLVVSVVSRVEASRAKKEFQESLNSVADNVSSAGDRINTHLEAACEHLSHLQYN